MRTLLIALIVSAQAVASSPFNLYSLAEETEIGRRTSGMFTSQLRIVHDPRIDTYVGELVTKLAGHIKSPFSYSVVVFAGHVPEGSRVKALVMPRDYTRTDFREPLSVAGGAVFVPLTLLADAPREEWFVFQIAHAMAHIASRHAARIESRMDVLATPELNGSSMDPSVAGPVFISFSRRFELDADAAAVHTMSDAGYDPSRVLPLGDPDRHESERLFSSMRVKAERRGDNLGKVVSQIPKRSYISSEAGFSEVKQAAVSRMQE